MSAAIIILGYLVCFYLSMAMLCGSWWRRFIQYAPPDPYQDGFPWGMNTTFSAMGPIGLLIGIGVLVLDPANAAIHFDWPLRMLGKREPVPTIPFRNASFAALSAQMQAQQAQMRANLAGSLYGVGGGGSGGSGGVGSGGGGNRGGGGRLGSAGCGGNGGGLGLSTDQWDNLLKMGAITVEQYHALVGYPPVLDDISVMFEGLRKIAAALPTIPDRDVPNTMGWRSWIFDAGDGVLRSPHIGTPWPDAELHCEEWHEAEVVRGVAGIHAHLVPYGWEQAPDSQVAGYTTSLPNGTPVLMPVVTGVVERFGKFVLGTEGWRAEWVIIRKLRAPNRAVAAALREIYPEVEVSYGDR